jgi:WD40 repeat protein/serine/threonine protein kinase/tetratricopeptide (TPR) repeat protein
MSHDQPVPERTQILGPHVALSPTGDLEGSKTGESSDAFRAELRVRQRIRTALEGKRKHPPRPNPRVPDHELIRLIGSGAYGEVWLAKNVVGTYRAVKVVYRDSFKDHRPYEREYRGIQRFEPISRSNDAFVDILQIGCNDEAGYFYYVMELADSAPERQKAEGRMQNEEGGRQNEVSPPGDTSVSSFNILPSYFPKTLRSEIQLHGQLPFGECVRHALSLNLAMGHLHRHGLIHRDIKPSNIIFIGGIPKLADIGLVTEVEEARSFVGTEGFIPPEGPNSPQADIYSLGKVLYEMSMGKDRLEFPEPFTELGQATRSQELEELNAVILKACAPNPCDRYQSAEEMHLDLALLQSGRSVKSKHLLERRLVFARKAGAVVGVVAAVAVGAYLYQQSQTREARHLAQQNQELVVKEAVERERAEGLLNTLHLRQAEHFFETDDANKGVAYLAHILRQNSSNHIAASRLMSALTDRSFGLPILVLEHTEEIRHAEFSSDGKRIVTCAGTGTNSAARIWDVETGKTIAGPIRHGREILVVRFSPDGRHLVTASDDRVIRIWDAKTGEPVGEPLRDDEPPSDNAGPWLRPEFSADGRMLLTGFDSKVRVWTFPAGDPATEPLNHTTGLRGAEFSPDGRQILTLGNSGAAFLWDARSARLECALPHGGPVASAHFSPDGRTVATASGAHVRLWEAKTGRQLLVLRNRAQVNSARFSPDGLRIVTIDTRGAARVWDAQTGQILTPAMVHSTAPNHVEFDLTGERLMTWEFGRTRVWDSRTGQALTEWMYGLDLSKARFSPDGLRLLTATMDNCVVLWDVRPGRSLNVALQHRAWVHSAKFSPDGSRVVTAAGGDMAGAEAGEWVIWDSATGDRLAGVQHSPVLTYAEFSSDGRRIVTAAGHHARIWDAQTGAPLTDAMRHNNSVESARFSPDGRKLVTASNDKSARVWDAQNGRPLTDPLPHPDEVRVAEFSPDGRWILSASFKAARVWDADTGKLQAELEHGRITDARFSPDANRVVTAAANGTVRIWDRETARVIGEPLQHQSYVWSARYSPDGRSLVTTPEIEGARIWDALKGMPVAEPLKHRGRIWLAQFSMDNQRVVTSSASDGIVRVWDSLTGRSLTEPFRHDDWSTAAEFHPAGNGIVTASRDGTARIREIPVSAVPMPSWITDLADAVAGQRLTDQEAWEPVPATQLLALKQQLSEMPEANRYVAWAKWLVADRLARTVSPNSSITAAKHLERLIEQNILRTLQEAIRFSPENSTVAARMARLTSAQNADEHPRKNDEAEFFAELALKLNPEEAEAWGAKAEVLSQTDRLPEALDAIDWAVSLDASDAALWHQKGQMLEKAQRPEEALRAYSNAVASASLATPDHANALKTALLARAKALNRLGRGRESAADVLLALGIPQRDPQAHSALLDLSSHYNLSLEDEIVQYWNGKLGKHDLAMLPRGVQVLSGVPFDIRGVIQVGCTRSRVKIDQATGIPVNQECRALHFLHAAEDLLNDDAPVGKRYGHYTVQYVDGESEIIPIEKNRSIGLLFAQEKKGGDSVIAWTGLNEATIEAGGSIELFKLSWPNPRPQVRIQSIGLEFTRTAREVEAIGSQEVICLIAITAQSEPTPTILEQPQPKIVAEGENVLFRVGAESEALLTYQWEVNGADIPGATNATLALNAVTGKNAGSYAVQVRNAIADSILTLTSQPAPLVVRAGGLSFGALRREMFTNINGTKLSDLTNDPRFPNNPNVTDLVYQFEAPSNIADNYGVRLTGYLVPPKTGEYRFHLCSDDEGTLFLSTTQSPEDKRQIAHEPEWNRDRLWAVPRARPTKNNVSAPIRLEAGRHYYVEALMKEGEGLDNLAVAWQMPGDPPPDNLSPPIPGASLAVRDERRNAVPSALTSKAK